MISRGRLGTWEYATVGSVLWAPGVTTMWKSPTRFMLQVVKHLGRLAPGTFADLREAETNGSHSAHLTS
jgi:hypothetical protein